MSVTRYRPFEEIRRLESEVSDIFRTFHSQFGSTNTLPINVEETNEWYRITAHLPGFDIEDINIEATSQFVEISAEREMEMEEDTTWLVKEINPGVFKRRINLDKPVMTSEAETTLKNGVLHLTLPKMEEAKSISLTPKLIEA